MSQLRRDGRLRVSKLTDETEKLREEVANLRARLYEMEVVTGAVAARDGDVPDFHSMRHGQELFLVVGERSWRVQLAGVDMTMYPEGGHREFARYSIRVELVVKR